MTKRLEAILQFITPCQLLADIGTDHALLPIEAYARGLCQRALACDIATGPLDIARKNIPPGSNIEVRSGDGLDALFGEHPDCIVIAGMGGMKIINILQKYCKHSTNTFLLDSTLILQPQHDIEDVRRFLHKMCYSIIDEAVVHDSGHYYEIIHTKKTQTQEVWSDREYFVGRGGSRDYQLYRRDKILEYLPYVTKATDRAMAEQRVVWLEEGL